MNYKGYRVGSIEKELLKIILNIKNNELPTKYIESFSDIFKTARQKAEYSNTIKRMIKKGIMKFVNKKGEVAIVLTSKGKNISEEYFLQNYKQIKKPLSWDKKWRLVMFDIPEDKRKLRNLIRFHLKKIGFIQMQGSVWIYPYPCEEIVTIIKTNFGLGDEVVYVTTESFSKDVNFKKIFRL